MVGGEFTIFEDAGSLFVNDRAIEAVALKLAATKERRGFFAQLDTVLFVVCDATIFKDSLSLLVDHHTARFSTVDVAMSEDWVGVFADRDTCEGVSCDLALLEQTKPTAKHEDTAVFAAVDFATPDRRCGLAAADGDTGEVSGGDIAIFEQQLALLDRHCKGEPTGVFVAT